MRTNLVTVRAVLVFSAIAGIAKCLAATGVLAGVRLFSRMRSQVRLQVLQTGIGLVATLELCRV